MQTVKANFSGKALPIKLSFISRKVIFITVVALCLTSFISAPIALLLGLVFANTIGHPFLHLNAKATKVLLQFSVVGLGFGMNTHSALKAGNEGVLFTIASIFGTLTIGYILGRLFRIDKKISQLISCGTAICGGSAIAAISPVIAANEKQISVGLGTVFILNSVALFLFPSIGHWLQMSQTQFGLWSAIAIHDTSSVVGAASKFGPEALNIATTVKLARALWIIPISLVMAFANRNSTSKIAIPWFIGLFVLAVLANTYIPELHAASILITHLAKAGLTLTLFFIGAGLSFSMLKTVGITPLLHGIVLWIVISIVALWAVMHWA